MENKPGKLQQLTDVLAKKNINMRALSLAETAEFGIVRIIVDDVEATAEVLQEESYVHTVTKVLGVAIPDEPGGLSRVLNVLSLSGVNVEYMYAFLGSKDAAHAYMIFHVHGTQAAVQALADAGIVCLTQAALAQM